MLNIFTNDPYVKEYFEDKNHCQHFNDLKGIPHEWIQVLDDDNPAGFLLLTRKNIVASNTKGKVANLYALRDTAKVLLSVMLSKKKKAR